MVKGLNALPVSIVRYSGPFIKQDKRRTGEMLIKE